jgi:hypothetical protein
MQGRGKKSIFIFKKGKTKKDKKKVDKSVNKFPPKI